MDSAKDDPVFDSSRAAWDKIRPPAGAGPGTLVIPRDASPTVVRLLEYTQTTVDEREVTDIESLRGCLDMSRVSWIDVQGLGDESTLRHLADVFSIHPLALEDVVHLPQRPKTELYDGMQYFVLRMAQLDGELVDLEQMSIFFGHGWALTFQERPGDMLDPVRRRIRGGGAQICVSGADYLAYAIIDAIIDAYYPVLEKLGDDIDQLEDDVISESGHVFLGRINDLKRDLLDLRRAIWPLRDAVAALIRDPSPFVTSEVKTFLRDVYDHCVQLSDAIETYRDLAAGLMNTYLSMLGHRTNEIMKVLTIIATVFIPLTFLVGVYGMNFDYLPELHVWWFYPALWMAMIGMAGGMMIWFGRQGWLGRRGR